MLANIAFQEIINNIHVIRLYIIFSLNLVLFYLRLQIGLTEYEEPSTTMPLPDMNTTSSVPTGAVFLIIAYDVFYV